MYSYKAVENSEKCNRAENDEEQQSRKGKPENILIIEIPRAQTRCKRLSF